MFTRRATLRVSRLGRTRYRVIGGFLLLGLCLWLLIQMHFNNLAYFVVTSESMEPTLHIGDRLVMKRPDTFARGEIVVLEKPGGGPTQLVKRLVAQAPDQVAQVNGLLYVNGQRNDPPAGPAEPTGDPDKSWALKQGEVFVVGDNRANSSDSRDFGPVPRETLRGVVRYRVVSGLHWVAVK